MGAVAVLHPQDCLTDNLFLTPVKHRRNPKPNPNPQNSTTRSETRKRSPPTGVRKHKPMVTDPPPAAAKNLVMGQVKILKRGEPLDESLTVLKESNDRKVTVKLPANNAVVAVTGDRKSLPAKKKVEKEKRRKNDEIAPVSANFKINNSKNDDSTLPATRIDDLKIDDFALSSTNRLGPDPEMVPKQMNKSLPDFFFAGSAFVDSPPPSSLPLPGFFNKNFSGDRKGDPSSDLRRLLGLSFE